MEGEQSLERFSPEVMVQDPRFRHAVSLLPLIVLLHGTADHSILSDASKAFAEALRKVQVELILYEGKTHTDLFLQTGKDGRAALELELTNPYRQTKQGKKPLFKGDGWKPETKCRANRDCVLNTPRLKRAPLNEVRWTELAHVFSDLARSLQGLSCGPGRGFWQ